jgi:osmotically-inducible protein OsmY
MREQMATIGAPHTIRVDDAMLAQRVYRALEDLKPLCVLGSPLHVQVDDGVVTLRGVVATYLDKLQIIQAVCGVPGVQQISEELWV